METTTIARAIEKMIRFYDGNFHDVDHFLRVWSYAKTIGELEGLDSETQFILELGAIAHDIACPSLRARYGTAPGKRQEEEGVPMTEAFLAEFELTREQIARVVFLVGRHHTYFGVEGSDWQILLEADYIANATERDASARSVRAGAEKFFRTASGKRLLTATFPE